MTGRGALIVSLFVLFFGLFFGGGSVNAQPSCTVEAVAGGGTGLAGLGGPAIEAELWSPEFVRQGPDGLVYFADRARHRILRVSAEGVLENVVGTGEKYTSASGGSGVSTSVGRLIDLEIDDAGRIYWLESDDGRTLLRRLEQGRVDTVAGLAVGASGDGGPALEAGIADVVDLAVTVDGSIYLLYRPFGLRSGGRVRRIAPDGTIDTVAGGGRVDIAFSQQESFDARDVELGAPQKIVALPDGDVLLRPGTRAILRRLTPQGQLEIVRSRSNFDGTPRDDLRGFLLQSDVAVDEAGRIYWLHRGQAFRTSAADLRPERLWSPTDPGFPLDNIVVLLDGSLATSRARQVQRLIGASEIEVLAGVPFDSLSGGDAGPAGEAVFFPADVAAAPNGGVYVADTYTRRVRLVRDGVIANFAGSGGQGEIVDGTQAVDAPISGLSEIVSDHEGNLFINTQFDILRVSAEGVITRFAGDGANCDRSFADPSCGDGGPASVGRLGGGLRMALDSEGVVYAAHIQRNADSRQEAVLRRIDSDGTIETLDVELPDSPIIRLAVDPQNRLIIFTASLIGLRLEEDGLHPLASASSPTFVANDVAVAPDGSFYRGGGLRSLLRILPDGSTDTIIPQLFDASPALTDGLPAGQSVIGSVHRVDMTSDGDLLVADVSADRIWRVQDIAACPATPETTPRAFSAAAPGLIAPGALFSIFGEDLGPQEGIAAAPDAAGRYPLEMAGTEVWMGGRRAPLLFVSFGQINGVIPASSELQGGFERVVTGGLAGRLAPMHLRRDGVDWPPRGMALEPSAPALFSLGPGRAAALNQDGSVNGPDNPAALGSVVVLFGTGGGDLDPLPETGRLVSGASLARVTLPVSAEILRRPAGVLYAGGAPGLVSGVLQLNLLIPEDLDFSGAALVEITIGAQSNRSQRLNVWVEQ